ncbi:MAG: flagellar export protein FliJ [Gammaproteobacteria bacterium]|nr:flagellar export protein FliJ [Gammaproteobacteria bacterium]
MDSQRLKPVQNAAETRERNAMKDMADAQRAVAEQEKRLEELKRYLAEYQKESERGLMSPALLVNRRAFLGRLEDAVRQQAQAVANAREACEAQRARWMLASRDTAVLEQLAECYRDREQRAAERIAQRDQDEAAMRRFQANVE